MYELDSFFKNVMGILERHKLGKTGAYRRWIKQNADGSRALDINEYGCADAANILYMIGEFPRDYDERAGWIDTLRSLQREDGLFVEATHHQIHTTAHCIAALELFDALPLYPLKALEKELTANGVKELLDGLNWKDGPWTASHEGAGIYSAGTLAAPYNREWEDAYFEWLWDNHDPETGFWRKGDVAPVAQGDSFSGVGAPSIFPHLAGAFHYFFNHQYARRPIRYPEKMIDTCLEIYHDNLWPKLGKTVSFAEIDWTYCLTRALRQCGHRFDDVMAALRAFADDYIAFLLNLDPMEDDGLNDLHTLFGAICCLAELQTALPGELRTSKPLKLVLDRRPFI